MNPSLKLESNMSLEVVATMSLEVVATIKNGGSFWMMINPYFKNGETHKPLEWWQRTTREIDMNIKTICLNSKGKNFRPMETAIGYYRLYSKICQTTHSWSTHR